MERSLCLLHLTIHMLEQWHIHGLHLELWWLFIVLEAAIHFLKRELFITQHQVQQNIFFVSIPSMRIWYYTRFSFVEFIKYYNIAFQLHQIMLLILENMYIDFVLTVCMHCVRYNKSRSLFMDCRCYEY